MIPFFVHPRAVIFNGDSAEIALPENSVDALVCDPPAGIAFMGKDWDEDKGGRDAWIAWLAKTLSPAFRALKPGGHGLVWALPRTSHWTAMALEECGFEIRDRVSHLFGTGFPKSLNVSKAIDAKLGKERPVVGKHPAPSRSNTALAIGGGWQDAPDLTAPGSPEAAAWEGWGTALKPACEDWWLVRKPIDGTVAANVLEYGTGGLNIDGCRIGNEARPKMVRTDTEVAATSMSGTSTGATSSGEVTTLGRWPAHLVLDDEAAAMLDAQSGVRKSGAWNGKRNTAKTGDVYGSFESHDELPLTGSQGGASRFFYVAKGSRSEKDAGCEHLPVKSGGEATGREDGSDGLKNPRAGAGRNGGARNTHPTVKSIALMRWLCRLITPPGGVILDPFFGSGSTGVAALAEGFSIIGNERDPGYVEIAKARIEHALKTTTTE
jgi:hypothetical protein